MNIIQKFWSLDRVSKCAIILFGTVATIYGGSKHTNNVPPISGLGLVPRSTEVSTLTNWHKRGAWNDWLHIDFPSSFRFPLGLGYIDRVTLMSNGALRTSLTNAVPLVSLPQAVSLEPGVSRVTHGLTPSNTYLFAWQDACINRNATNRVDGAIELFPNGSMVRTFGNTVRREVPIAPPGYVGHGQDHTWATNAFPWAASAIAAKGYEDWLMEDYVGINEQNGRYKATITVSSLPASGAPCYLECGPYKVIVTEPGDYSFPLEVFEHYAARTYPDALPLSVAYDEGYRSGSMGLTSPTPPLMMSMPILLPPLLLDIHMEPKFHIEPSTVYLRKGESANVWVWVNSGNASQKTWYSMTGSSTLVWLAPTYANIYASYVDDLVVMSVPESRGEIEGLLRVIRLPGPEETLCEHCSITNCPCFGWCLPNCQCHPEGTNACITADWAQ